MSISGLSGSAGSTQAWWQNNASAYQSAGDSDSSSTPGASATNPLAAAIAAALAQIGVSSNSTSSTSSTSDSSSSNSTSATSATSASTVDAALQQFLGGLFQAAAPSSTGGTVSVSISATTGDMDTSPDVDSADATDDSDADDDDVTVTLDETIAPPPAAPQGAQGYGGDLAAAIQNLAQSLTSPSSADADVDGASTETSSSGDSSSDTSLSDNFQNLLTALGSTDGSSSSESTANLQSFLTSLASSLQNGTSSVSGLFISTSA